ncbi:MAG: sporulation protein YunB [Syntrophomonadaceae bacterium]
MFNPRVRRYRIKVFILLAVIVLVMVFIDFKIKSSLLQIAKSKAQVSGIQTLNQIVNDKIVSDIDYQDLIYLHKDSTGRIVLIQPNTIMLNKIMADTVVEVSESLISIGEDIITIPMGQLFGARMLAGYGPKLKVKVIHTGQIHVDVLDRFEQAGINQTRHLVYFKIDNELKIAVPFFADKVNVSATIPLAETIIVGDVPKTFVNFTGHSEALYPFINE